MVGTSDVAPTPEPVERPPEPKPTPGGKYVPPSMRGDSSRSYGGTRKKKTAPNITSEEDFPTLGMAQPE